jgi:hypothetical protein
MAILHMDRYQFDSDIPYFNVNTNKFIPPTNPSLISRTCSLGEYGLSANLGDLKYFICDIPI